MDKAHRLFYQKLEKKRSRYDKEKLDLHANMRFLLVQVEMVRKGELEAVRIVNNKITKAKARDLLEPASFYLMLSMGHLGMFKRSASSSIGRIITSVYSHLEMIKDRLVQLQSSHPKSTDEIIHENNEVLAAQMEKVKDFVLKERFNAPSVERNIMLALFCIQKISEMTFGNSYDLEKDIFAWTQSIHSSNITQSCTFLSGLSKIPIFILADILLRTPISKSEYNLQLDIWDTYLKDIAIHYHSKSSFLKEIIANLAFYGIHLESKKLPFFFGSMCDFFADNKSGYKFSFFDEDFCNDLIWKLIYDSLEAQVLNPRIIISDIIKSQEVIIKYFSSVGSSKDKTRKLNLVGSMGIVAAIDHIDKSKARTFFEFAERKYVYGSEVSNRRSLVSYNTTKVLISTTPEELLHNFNKSAVEFSNSATIWTAFISKLISFELLNEKRALKILAELLKSKDHVLISKTMIRMLTSPLVSISAIETFIKTIEEKSSILLQKHSNTLISAYLAVLYKNLDSTYNSEWYFPWDKPLKPSTTESSIASSGFKGHMTLVDYARFLYNSCLPKKTASVVGIMLIGEARLQPENLYDMYISQLAEHHLSPNQACLNALIKAATVTVKDTNSCVMWKDMYAPQLAIHEFKKHVAGASQDHLQPGTIDPGIHPTDSIWRNYILMLAKFSYTSELAAIIQWWELLDFFPSSHTLCTLLASLPEQYSHRYIQHIEKLNHDSLYLPGPDFAVSVSTNSSRWPWPTLQQFELFCKYYRYKPE